MRAAAIQTGCLAVALVLAGCTTPRLGRVLPDAGPMLKAVSEAGNRDEAEASALHTAETACKQRKARYVYMDLRTDYHGLLSEEARRAAEKISGVIEDNTRQVLPTLSRDDDYRSTLWFKCEA